MANFYRKGDWTLHCDICGQKCFASESYKLSEYTGRGGLIVCKNDVDKIDYGLVPYISRTERQVPFTRINHTSTADSAPIFDYESDTVESISDHLYLTTSQGATEYILTSQGELLATSQGV